jgi:hypothetical protein
MNSKLIIIIIAIIAVVGVIGIIANNTMESTTTSPSDLNVSAENKVQIIIEADANFNGTIIIYTYSNLKKNENGSYNITEFYKKHVGYKEYKGNEIEIPIINGKATYDLPENTQFFIVAPLGETNEIFEDIDRKITLDFYINGKLIEQANSVIDGPVFEIIFGDKIYDAHGNTLKI